MGLFLEDFSKSSILEFKINIWIQEAWESIVNNDE